MKGAEARMANLRGKVRCLQLQIESLERERDGMKAMRDRALEIASVETETNRNLVRCVDELSKKIPNVATQPEEST